MHCDLYTSDCPELRVECQHLQASLDEKWNRGEILPSYMHMPLSVDKHDLGISGRIYMTLRNVDRANNVYRHYWAALRFFPDVGLLTLAQCDLTKRDR